MVNVINNTKRFNNVAVLMSVYCNDNSAYFKKAIESMLHQTYENLDIHIYIDGNINKQLLDTLTYYKNKFNNIFLYSNPKNRGLAFCLNDLIELTKDKYEYFARMDADDISLANRIEEQVKFLDVHKDIDAVGTFIIDVDENCKEIKRVRYPVTHDEIVKFFKVRNPLAHVSVVFRKSFFDKAGLYPSTRLEDGIYWMQGIMSGCRFHNIPQCLIYVRRSNDYLRRRGGLLKGLAELKIKFTINHNLKYGLDAYIYAIVMFLIQLLPAKMKHLLYNKLR